MRIPLAIVSLLAVLASAAQLERYGLHARQDEVAPATESAPSSTTASAESSPTPTSPASTGSASKTESNATTSSQHPSGDATSPITLAPTATPETSPYSNATTPGDQQKHPNALPTKPELTPALGVAGAFLMIAGLLLAFVGIKHRPTQTFLSTCLLIALGIEALIIYLMHPPVPNAIQGAYVVAGVVGGCLLGSLALIFKEVSEGFGCVLGGFCLAMWLLTLAPGGLITNQVGRIILIAVFCAACFCLYISRYTRVYGIIGCTSFAGSTAFLLGTDCFSKAGLKEFWMYIWNLNDNAFPPFTRTYPISRNMKAETAAIIIVAFLGTLSQVKIWKIVKEQTAKREASRLRQQELRDAEEAEAGRDIETRIARDRAVWEGDYDGKKASTIHGDSAVGMTENIVRKDSAEDSHNTSSKDGDKRFPFPPLVKIRPSTRDSYRRRSSTFRRTPTASIDFLPGSGERASAVPSLPPLSFGDDDATSFTARPPSIAAASPSATTPVSPGLGGSGANAHKESRGVEMDRLSIAFPSAKAAQAVAQQECDWEPGAEDDLASSLAATLAESPDMDTLSTKALSPPTSAYFPYGAETSQPCSQEELIEDNDDEALFLPRTSPSAGPGSNRLSVGSRASGQSPAIGANGSGASREPVELKDRLPKRMSTAAQNYRTGEWAKELTRAEPEPVEEVPEHTLDATQVETNDAAERARARENNASPLPPPRPAPPKPEPVAEPPLPANKSSHRLFRMPSGTVATPIYAHALKPGDSHWSTPVAKRTSSSPVVKTEPAIDEEGPRNVSAPILERQPSLDYFSPSRTNRNSQMPSRLSQLPGRATPNLLDERRDRLSNRITTTSFMTPSPDVTIGTASTSDASKHESSTGGKSSATSLSDRHAIEDDDEDMTLAERKTLVQRRSVIAQQNANRAQVLFNARMPTQDLRDSTVPAPLVNAIPGSTTTPAPKPVRVSFSGTKQPMYYGSHQPRRISHNANKQATNWSAWRSSNAIAMSSRNSYTTADSQMDALRAARMQTETEAKLREQRQKEMQEQIDTHMRMGAMHDRHREVLSRMQNKVDKNI